MNLILSVSHWFDIKTTSVTCYYGTKLSGVYFMWKFITARCFKHGLSAEIRATNCITKKIHLLRLHYRAQFAMENKLFSHMLIGTLVNHVKALSTE